MSKWEEKRLEDIIDVNPPVKLKKGESYPFIDIDKVSPTRRSVTNEEVKVYNGQSSSKFCDGDTVFSRITPCLENRKIAKVAIEGDAAYIYHESMRNINTPLPLGIPNIVPIVEKSCTTAQPAISRRDRIFSSVPHIVKTTKNANPTTSVQSFWRIWCGCTWKLSSAIFSTMKITSVQLCRNS